MLAEEAAREVHIFGRDPHALAGSRAQRGRDVVEIGHRAHIDPGARNRDHDIGIAEAERGEQQELAVGVGDGLAQQVLAGDSEMRVAGSELRHDLGGRQEEDLDVIDALEGAAIVACSAFLAQPQAGAREEGIRPLLQASFRRDGDDELTAHGVPGAARAATRSIQIEQPTAGTSLGAPSLCNRPS